MDIRGTPLLYLSLTPHNAHRLHLFLKAFLIIYGLLLSSYSIAQKTDSVSNTPSPSITTISGVVVDDATGQLLPFIEISFAGSKFGTTSGKDGRFELSAPGKFSQASFSYVGYQTIIKSIKSGQANVLRVQMHSSETQLKEVSVVSGKKPRYRNKGNPAVELIQLVIDHKPLNRMESTDYLQYNQYERVNLWVVNPPAALLDNRYFKMYKFMLDSTKADGQSKALLPVFVSEKQFQYYYRRDPSKSIRVLKAQKEMNVLKFIDTAGFEIILNRIYGNNIDIYENNIFIANKQFLSPIADHSLNYYKFFITDTIITATEKLIELSFTPREKADLLFEGKLLVSMTGDYAVKSCELKINRQANVNFIRSLNVRLDFDQHSGGRYFLTKSDVKADFGILKKKSVGTLGERTVFYSDYRANTPQDAKFYRGNELQTAVDANRPDTAYWLQHRPDTLTAQQAKVYPSIDKLEKMPQFKRATWIASTLSGGYAKWGPVLLGPLGDIYSFGSQEGSRFQFGGRTTPELSKSVYFEGFAGYGTKDRTYKYNLATYFSLNQTAFYRYPNNYLKLGYIYDVGIPGQNFSAIDQQEALASFQSGTTYYWLYNKIVRIDYVKDLENHFSYNIAFRNWNQRPAGALMYQYNRHSHINVPDLTTSEVDLSFRYAPYEQFTQGSVYRHIIHGRYPIFNISFNHGFKDLLDGAYNYTTVQASIYKRFYLSQLGYADITVLGSYLAGKVPFPLLNISPANQSITYDPDAYNQMTYLEFVSDHYAGINITQGFNGFFLNKVPLIKHLKLREFLSAKVLFGGVRDENNPHYTANLYRLPASIGGANGTYPLGDRPYIEAGLGIGNILKFIRIDGIKRFNYLDHPGAPRYSIKVSLTPHL